MYIQNDLQLSGPLSLSTSQKSTGQFEKVLQNQAQQKPASPEKLKQATQEFEAFFLTQMLGEMRKTIPKSDFLSGGPTEDMYQGWLDQSLGEELAKGQGMGLAQMLYKQLQRSADISEVHR